jgi:hypothetical protein
MRMLTLLVLLAALITGIPSEPAGADEAVAPSPSVTAPATSTVTFGISPASLIGGRPVVDERPYLYYASSAGAELTDQVVITNYSTSELHLHVYPTDSVPTADGGFALLDADQHPVDVGAWARLTEPTTVVTVPPRSTNAAGGQVLGQALVPITIQVPADASPGDHVGAVVASLDAVGSLTNGAGVRLDQRVATRLFVRIAGTLHPSLAVTNVVLNFTAPTNPLATATAKVNYTVRNEGNVKLAAQQMVRIQGPAGMGSRSQQPPELAMLLPGSQVNVTAVVPGVRAIGRLTAKVTLRAQPVGSDADPAIPAVTGGRTLTVLPWNLLTAFGLGVLLLVGTAILLRRAAGRGRHNRSHRQAQRRTVGAHAAGSAAQK